MPEEEENEPDDFARADSDDGEFEEQTPGGAFANF